MAWDSSPVRGGEAFALQFIHSGQYSRKVTSMMAS